MNFIAANIDGSSALISGPGSESNRNYPADHKMNNEDARAKIHSLGYSAINPLYVVQNQYGEPAAWGNNENDRNKFRANNVKEGKVNGTAHNTVYYYFDTFE